MKIIPSTREVKQPTTDTQHLMAELVLTLRSGYCQNSCYINNDTFYLESDTCSF